MTGRYRLIDHSGYTISFADDIKAAYRAASRLNRRVGFKDCVAILDDEIDQAYSLTCLSRRRDKDHGRNVMNRFYKVSKSFDAYERKHGIITSHGLFAYEMFDMGFSLI